MGNENGHWSEPIRLGDLVQIAHGWPFKSKFFSEELTGKPIVVNIGNFEYTGGFRFASTTVKEYRAEYPTEYELQPNDILLVMTCQTAGGEILGIPGRIPNDGRTYLHNQRLGKVVIKEPTDLDPDFLYWVFLWSEFNRELFVSATGTKILHTAPKRIEAFTFRLPPLWEQKAIAHILATLDDKIELNRRMNATLETMARAMFKSWFVDFDPVRAKMDGRQPVGMDEATAALFPDAFEHLNEKFVPKGWIQTTLGEEVDFQTGFAFKSKYFSEQPPGIRLARGMNVKEGEFFWENQARYWPKITPDIQDYLLNPGDVLIHWHGRIKSRKELGESPCAPAALSVGATGCKIETC